MSYNHFTLEERIMLAKLLENKELSIRRIAQLMGRSPSTISREIKRNRSKRPSGKPLNPFNYHPWRAQILTIERRKQKAPWALLAGTEAWDYVVKGLNNYWSPETIIRRWRLEHPAGERFGASTIYRYVKAKLFPKITAQTHLRRRGKRIMPRQSNYNTIHPDRTIPDWPEVIKLRQRIGDWEGDTVYGGVGLGLLLTMVDRQTRYLRAWLLPSRKADVTKDAIIQCLQGLPVHSISLDNGSEFAAFHEVEKALDTLVYFAEPHKPWQRGTNENTNDILRFFFPKGFNFRKITQEDVDAVVELINNRPRKCLGWKSPAEVFAKSGVALA